MIILGIDPGLAIVGYSVVEYENKQYKLLASGSIKTNQTDREEKRLFEVFEDMCFLCKKYTPSVASIEKLYFFKLYFLQSFFPFLEMIIQIKRNISSLLLLAIDIDK